MKRILSFIVLVTILLSFASCKKEAGNSGVDVSGSQAAISKADRIHITPIIVRGVPTKINSVVRTNPDGTVLDKNGNPVFDSQITDYSFEVIEVYKGECADEINVKARDDFMFKKGLDQKDGYYRTGTVSYDLEIGKECVLMLCYSKDNEGFPEGYYLTFDDHGNYVYDEQTSRYVAKAQVYYDDFSFGKDTVRQEIEAALSQPISEGYEKLKQAYEQENDLD